MKRCCVVAVVPVRSVVCEVYLEIPTGVSTTDATRWWGGSESVPCSVFRVSCSVFRVSSSVFRVCSEFRVSSSEFRGLFRVHCYVLFCSFPTVPFSTGVPWSLSRTGDSTDDRGAEWREGRTRQGIGGEDKAGLGSKGNIRKVEPEK
ncbi:hypothetical protein F5051DRAFT_423239 [Lentinula edodes]|nr:hypothetical protein F5051DRAFT_423239 [Lentinula edodes]